MTTKRTEVRARREPWICDKISIQVAYIVEQDGARSVAIARPPEKWLLSEEGLSAEHEPMLRVTPEEAQQFMDELWRVGIRPTEGAGSVGQLGAVQAHLKDLQKLVFKTE